MKLFVYFLIVPAVLTGLLTGCSTPQISSRPVEKSDPVAVALVAASQEAQGGRAFRKLRTIQVAYEGKWASIGPKLQPILADESFRSSSKESYDLRKNSVLQEHTASGGKKNVVRSPGKISVTYNGVLSNDEEVKQAAALVADAYTLFLLGPHYFSRNGVILVSTGEGKVDGAWCDEVLSVMQPGFGFAKEDRVLLSIDRTTKRLVRVRMTLNGLDSTVGAEVDVTFRKFREISGVLWPTDFDERIRVPVRLHAHHWRLVDLTAQ